MPSFALCVFRGVALRTTVWRHHAAIAWPIPLPRRRANHIPGERTPMVVLHGLEKCYSFSEGAAECSDQLGCCAEQSQIVGRLLP